MTTHQGEGSWESQLADLGRSIDTRPKKLDISRSEALWGRAERTIPEGTQSLSKGPSQYVVGVSPIFLSRAIGPYVWDVDGNQFIDYPMALGAILLGHSHPAVVDAVRDQLASGTSYSLMHPLEVEVAELLVDMIPCAEMVRFGKNGSDVTAAAIRLARAVTGRWHVLTCGYHGWHDWYAGLTPRPAGVPVEQRELVRAFAYNDLAGLEALVDELAGDVAAIILEQPGDEPRDGFLHEVRAIADRIGAVLIFDEVVTSFRYAIGGAQELYAVTPDLACVGKGMANGLPLLALVGRRDLMESLEDVFFTGTFGGETLALAAAKATLSLVRAGEVVDPIWERGRELRDGMTELIRASGLEIEVTGNPPRSRLVYLVDGEESQELRALFLQETVRRGVLFGPPLFLTPSHSAEDIARTLDAVDAALGVMVKAVESGAIESYLDGAAPAPSLVRLT